MINWWFGARCFGFLGSPYEGDCYFEAPLESQTNNPNHQFTTTPPKIISSPLQNDGWKNAFLLGWSLFRGKLLNFRGVVETTERYLIPWEKPTFCVKIDRFFHHRGTCSRGDPKNDRGRVDRNSTDLEPREFCVCIFCVWFFDVFWRGERRSKKI